MSNLNVPTNCLPYSHHRIKAIMKSDYHIYLKPIWGYKINRKRNYVTKYKMINIYTQEIVAEGITLNALRMHLTKEGYPLKETIKPCQGAIEFLEFVESQKK